MELAIWLESEDLVGDDGKIIAHYLPPNVTSLIQPMDQGVLEALKRQYKKKILRKLLIGEENGESVVDFLKSVDMKVVADLIAESWDEIESSTIQKSWRKIIASTVQQPDTETPSEEPSSHGGTGEEMSIERHDAGEKEGSEDQSDVAEFIDTFQELGYNMNEDEISIWLNSDRNDPGFQIMTDDEICDYVTSEADHQDNEDGESEELNSTCPISNSHAAHMLEKCLVWLEHQPEANEYNVCTLRQLRALAARKRVQSLKQKTLMDMLPNSTTN